MDKGKIPIGIFLDLSKAIDTLNHQILIKKLDFLWGIKTGQQIIYKLSIR